MNDSTSAAGTGKVFTKKVGIKKDLERQKEEL
jgi:hypothetical protein